MKKITLLISFIVILFITNACTKKCQICSNVYGSTTDMKFCKEDFSSTDEYNKAIDLVKSAGAKCK